jgi:hypothetical protein
MAYFNMNRILVLCRLEFKDIYYECLLTLTYEKCYYFLRY